MLGKGIYFATNYKATFAKANNKGIVVCARLRLGKTKIITQLTQIDGNEEETGFECLFFKHPGGDEYNEFVIYDEDQILNLAIITK